MRLNPIVWSLRILPRLLQSDCLSPKLQLHSAQRPLVCTLGNREVSSLCLRHLVEEHTKQNDEHAKGMSKLEAEIAELRALDLGSIRPNISYAVFEGPQGRAIARSTGFHA